VRTVQHDRVFDWILLLAGWRHASRATGTPARNMWLFFVSYITVKCPRRLDVSQIATRRPPWPWVPGTENRQPVTTPGPLVPPTYRYTTRLHYRLPRSCSCRAVGPTRLSTREAAARPRCLSVILEEPGPGGSVTFTVTRDADCLARCRCRDTG
jgi:hypothetical protein